MLYLRSISRFILNYPGFVGLVCIIGICRHDKYLI
jgi:hypothetical protein